VLLAVIVPLGLKTEFQQKPASALELSPYGFSFATLNTPGIEVYSLVIVSAKGIDYFTGVTTMVTKVKKPVGNTDTSAPRADSSAIASAVKDSAQQIWLAGLGAFAKAQDEGTKVFESLVKEGLTLQRKTQSAAEERITEATSKMANMASGISSRAVGQWDKLETIFEERVGKALNNLGVPTVTDLALLAERVAALEAALAVSAAPVVTAAQAAPAAAKRKSAPAKAKVAVTAKAAAAPAPAERVGDAVDALQSATKAAAKAPDNSPVNAPARKRVRKAAATVAAEAVVAAA
jgi:poly(hydroxyalkanoate) granule-associated protein